MKVLSNGVKFYPIRERRVVSVRKKWFLFGPIVESETAVREGVFLRLFAQGDKGGPYTLGLITDLDNLGVGFDSAEEGTDAYLQALRLERSNSKEMHEVDNE